MSMCAIANELQFATQNTAMSSDALNDSLEIAEMGLLTKRMPSITHTLEMCLILSRRIRRSQFKQD